MFIFLVTFLLLYTLYKCFTNVLSAEIQSCSQSNSILTCLVRLQYFLRLVSLSSLAVSRSISLIAYIYFLARLTRLNAWVTSAGVVVSTILSNSPSFFFTFFSIITSFITIILVWHMLYSRICKLYSFLVVLL